MRTVAVIEVDLDVNPLGLPSRALEPFGATTVLGRVLERLGKVAAVDEVIVVAPERDHPQLGRTVESAGARLQASQCPDVPFRQALRRSRYWSLEGWRGGIGGTCLFDEQANFSELDRIARDTRADAILSVRAEAPLIDPTIIKQLLADSAGRDGTVRFSFTTAPPGLAGEVYRPEILKELAAAGQTLGFTMRYHPNKPQADLIDQPCTLKLDTGIVASPWRYLADSKRFLDRAGRLAEGADGGGAEAVVAAMADRPELWPGPIARDILVEVTTERELSDPFLPAGKETGRRESMTLDRFEKLATSIGQLADDVVLTFGGLGDPLLCPDIVPMISAACSAGVLGTALVTDGLALQGRLADELLDSPLDVLVVRLDAHDAATYKKLKGVDAYDRVVGNINAFLQRRRDTKQFQPLVVVQMTKCRDNLAQMGDFFDHWLLEADWAAIVGPSTYAGRRADLSVMPMTPPKRTACRRIFSRLTVLADGTVPRCEEDFRAEAPLGNAFEESIGSIWHGSGIEALRRAHRQGSVGEDSLCAACQEWFRP